MEILGKLFGSEDKVKIMRLFLFNPERVYDKEEIANRAKSNPYVVKHELEILEKIGLIKKKGPSKKAQANGNGSIPKLSGKGPKRIGWMLDSSFPYLPHLQNVLINTVLLKDGEILNKLHSVGKLKLVITSGVFMQYWDARVDLLVVGDSLRMGYLDSVIKTIEAEIGKEIRYAAFETSEFQYRLKMYDKLVRDIIDYPHSRILDRLNVGQGNLGNKAF